ncbi:MAG: hypothetical protein PHY47_16120 [Lachnospiraceae bacterium]|nr:hypothetical protein [Lachnospiraceae bacterium]
MIPEDLKKNYWSIVKRTRQSGRISQSVIDRVEESWKSFDDDVVTKALQIHASHYRAYKENYTIGIMRNLQKQKAAGVPVDKKKNSFNDFEQRTYDFDELEKILLSN